MRCRRAGAEVQRQRTRRCVTLVETMTVVAILSLIAVVASVRLASTARVARLRAAAGEWRNVDAQARLFARTAGPILMSLSPEGTELRLHVVESGESLATAVLPPDVTGRLVVGTRTRAVVFDRLGQSADYEVELRAADRVRRWRVLGLTGQIGGQRP